MPDFPGLVELWLLGALFLLGVGLVGLALLRDLCRISRQPQRREEYSVEE
jgi:hypothetical protein